MKQATKITITRAEGLSEECGTVTVEHGQFNEGRNVWALADLVLRGFAYTAPEQGGHKTDFVITWEDGQTYEGCLMLHRGNAIEWGIIADHMIRFFRSYQEMRGDAGMAETFAYGTEYEVGRAA